jgi:hypothetical protein
MIMRNKKAVVTIAAIFCAGAVTHAIGLRTPRGLCGEMQRFQTCAAGMPFSDCLQAAAASSKEDDWTAWGGAMRGSPALKHADQAQRPRGGRRGQRSAS